MIIQIVCKCYPFGNDIVLYFTFYFIYYSVKEINK